MKLYVLSDLHLDERSGARLFDDERQGRKLASLCERIAADDGAELILLGDTFDFTAMQAPRGLSGFFRSLGMPPPQAREPQLRDMVDAVAASNPVAFRALREVSEAAAVTVVPGNHDHQLANADAATPLARHGLRVRIAASCTREAAGKSVVLQHGHAWDEGNSRPGGRGEMMTRILHQAVIPYLRFRGSPPHVQIDPDRVVALRPEEHVISVLQRWLDEREFRRFFRAFLQLLAENDYFPRPLSWLARVATADQVRRAVANQDRLWERTGRRAIDALKGRRKLPHGAPPPDVLVFGHTHVLDWAVEGSRLYVNLGTWTERAFDASSPPDASLPLLRVEEVSGQLVVTLVDLASGDELQRFSSPP